ncbi:energy-coupling factor transporter transmembrane component T family protein [Vibrio palustris]|uniref:Energy-coupling factor transporter transmembrane protein BioN n=1 Tax=Vibrio palustris TaxID=1918946 RepID=A0A1R4B117_9VIBR|nr:energy-coupling factor transporter transmembrane protein EcfT [Vibrio palustris]SJL82612.1 Energy-coupling factor transporter transmembrane protein BioN [Vibrio palustris]
MISLTSPVNTRAHHWPAGQKLAALCITTLTLFFIENIIIQASVLLLVLCLYALPGWSFFKHGWKALSLLFPFIVLVGIWHVWIGEYQEGATLILRLLSTVALANLVTMTTRLSDMVDVVSLITRPLQKIGLNPHALEVAIALVIRMTPVLITKGQSLKWAWQARSYKRSGWRILLPFTILALDDADHVADAIRARGGINPVDNDAQE